MQEPRRELHGLRDGFEPEGHRVGRVLAIARLPELTRAPGPHGAVVPAREAEDGACGDLANAGEGRDLHGRRAVRRRAVAALAAGIVAPGPDGSVPLEGDRVARPGRYLHDIGKPRDAH